MNQESHESVKTDQGRARQAPDPDAASKPQSPAEVSRATRCCRSSPR